MFLLSCVIYTLWSVIVIVPSGFTISAPCCTPTDFTIFALNIAALIRPSAEAVATEYVVSVKTAFDGTDLPRV